MAPRAVQPAVCPDRTREQKRVQVGDIARAHGDALRAQDTILPVPYFHLVFTLPSELRPIVAMSRERLFALMFEAARRRQCAACPKAGLDEDGEVAA